MHDEHANALQFRFRHTMLPVADLERSVDFYCRLLGMSVLRRRSDQAGGRSVAYVGYGDEATHPALELISGTGNAGTPWAGHIAIAVSDVHGLCATLQEEGIRFARPLAMGSSGSLRPIVLDPDGFEVELTAFTASAPPGGK